MTLQEFESVVSQDEDLSRTIQSTASALKPPISDGKFEWLATAGVGLVVFALARFILVRIGPPWLHEAERFSELWRQRFHDWVDEQYRARGYDPESVAAAGAELRKELEQIKDEKVQRKWDNLAKLLGRGASESEELHRE